MMELLPEKGFEMIFPHTNPFYLISFGTTSRDTGKCPFFANFFHSPRHRLLFSDAESTENFIEHFVRVESAKNMTEFVESDSQFTGDQRFVKRGITVAD